MIILQQNKAQRHPIKIGIPYKSRVFFFLKGKTMGEGKNMFNLFEIDEIIQAFTHSLAVFILLLTLTRIIGKKFLGQMTFFDFVTGITMGTIGGAWVTTQVKGAYVLFGPVFLTIFVFLTGVLTFKSAPARKLIEGEPLIVIQNGKIFENNMKKIRYNSDDLLMQLREKGVFDLTEVEFAILEPHGQLSVLRKSQYLNLTPNDMAIATKYKGVSSEIIRDGRIVSQNLEQNNLTYEWLFDQLATQGVGRVEDIYLATLSTDGVLYLDKKEDQLDYVQKVEDDKSLI